MLEIYLLWTSDSSFLRKGDCDCSWSQDCGSPGGQVWLVQFNRLRQKQVWFYFFCSDKHLEAKPSPTLPSMLLVASPLFSSAAVLAHELCFFTSSAAAPHVVPSPLPGPHTSLLSSSQYVSNHHHCRFSHLAAYSSSDLVALWPTSTSSLPFPGLPRSPKTSTAQHRCFSPGLHIIATQWVLNCTLSSSPYHVPY